MAGGVRRFILVGRCGGLGPHVEGGCFGCLYLHIWSLAVWSFLALGIIGIAGADWTIDVTLAGGGLIGSGVGFSGFSLLTSFI